MKKKFSKKGLDIIAYKLGMRQVSNDGIRIEQLNPQQMLITVSGDYGFFSARISIDEYKELKEKHTING